MPGQIICKFRGDPTKTIQAILRTRSNMMVVTPKGTARSGRNSNLSDDLSLSWLPASLMKIRSEVKALSSRQ